MEVIKASSELNQEMRKLSRESIDLNERDSNGIMGTIDS